MAASASPALRMPTTIVSRGLSDARTAGCGLRSDKLDEIESKGWWCSDIFPMAANLQFVFYRSNPNDKDILFKVLLNEKEARLPIHTDCAPYYHWKDFRRHYLKKINDFEKKQKKQ